MRVSSTPEPTTAFNVHGCRTYDSAGRNTSLRPLQGHLRPAARETAQVKHHLRRSSGIRLWQVTLSGRSKEKRSSSCLAGALKAGSPEAP